MTGYRTLSNREAVYLNIEEAELLKSGLYEILGTDPEERDAICDLVHELNECICECKRRQQAEPNEI